MTKEEMIKENNNIKEQLLIGNFIKISDPEILYREWNDLLFGISFVSCSRSMSKDESYNKNH